MTRSDLDALKWHTANIAAGASFTVPTDKIYEIFLSADTEGNFLLNGKAIGYVFTTAWFPVQGYYSFSNIDPATGAVTAQDYWATTSCGYIVSDGDIITHSIGAATFVVRWRDVTEQQLGY